ncbi:hypothetical protein [Nannocystis sp. SCPEA4]|uniref:hypothetical protein n=1 Tax=Nannocystis sp. SCPEA4 TaxID=2996787 RepID=UPI0022717E3A|nr:hypothetical protein [Nannocystis sp. SCPEA4]MCY1054191.1 hypothetical protein [Nannocystis sp. SCPEA4]
MDLAAAFSQHLPISSAHYSLEIAEQRIDGDAGEAWSALSVNAEGDRVVTVRLVVWEVDGDDRSIRDIKEQDVVVVPAAHVDDPRVPAYFDGWAAAVRTAFTRLEEVIVAEGEAAAGNRVEEAVPYEMFCPEVLELRRPQTAEEFTDALLSNRKRLGWLLP